MSTVESIIDLVAEAAVEIRAGLPGRRETLDEENPSGELQYAADVWADRLLAERFRGLPGVGTFASEERASPVDVGEGLSVTLDPLDGSSNLRSNNAMGTILGIYDAPLPAAGTDLVAAGYVLYGPITTMTVAVGGTVTEYVVEADGKHAIRSDVTLPDDPVVYGFGGRVPEWPPAFETFAREIEGELKLRYGGAMIGDVNQVMTYGGIFSYPGLRSRPQGKLRLQFEGAPMAYVVESAGGRSSDGDRSLLEKAPADLHERTPVHLGNATLIDRLEAALA